MEGQTFFHPMQCHFAEVFGVCHHLQTAWWTICKVVILVQHLAGVFMIKHTTLGNTE